MATTPVTPGASPGPLLTTDTTNLAVSPGLPELGPSMETEIWPPPPQAASSGRRNDNASVAMHRPEIRRRRPRTLPGVRRAKRCASASADVAGARRSQRDVGRARQRFRVAALREQA